MKSKVLQNVRRSTWGKKLFVYLSVSAMLFQYTYTAYASALTSEVIYSDISKNPMYQLAGSSSRYQYTAKPYFESSALSARDLKWFYNQLFSNYKENLGDPTYVPIMVGDITNILPIYDQPRFVGSPLVQSRYIRFQVRNLLGRNLIDSEQAAYSSEVAQLNTLYANALEYLENENADAIYGQNLGLDQTNSGLSQDIVWPEFRTINGERVVVPVVYLTGATYSERKVTEHETQFNGTSQFNNLTIENVNVKFGRRAFLDVAGDLNNGGSIAAAGDMQFAITGALNNVSGLIQAEGDLRIGAHSINNQTVVHRYDFGGNQSGRFGEVASINSTTGDVVLRSHSDILVQGGIVDAAGAITFAADGDIYIGPVQFTEHSSNSSSNWTHQQTSTEILQSRLSASQTIQLVAQGSIKIDASEIVSDQGHIELLAGLGITIEDELGSYQSATTSSFGDTDAQTSTYKTVAIRSVLDAGKGVRLHTDFGDITLKAADITSTAGTAVKAENGGVNLLLTKETDHYSYSATTESLFTVESVSRGHDIETAVHNSIVGGLHVEALNALNIEYEGIRDGTFEDQIENFRNIEGLSWMADLKDQMDSDSNIQIDWEDVQTAYKTWNESNTSLSPAAIAVITIIVAVCTAGAGAAAVGAVQGTTAATAATAHATTVAVTQAAITSMATTATIATSNALVNGENFFEATSSGIDAVINEEGLKSTATAMVTAGIIAQIDAEFFNVGEANGDSFLFESASQGSGYELTLQGQAFQALAHSSARAGIDTLIDGGNLEDFGDSFLENLSQSAVSRIGQEMTSTISSLAASGDINSAIEYVVLAGSGCITGALSGKANSSNENGTGANCYSGALGNVVGRAIGELINSAKRDELIQEQKEFLFDLGINGNQDIANLTHEEYANYLLKLPRVELLDVQRMQRQGVDIARLTGAFLAFAAGADVNITADNSGSTAQYGRLNQLNQVLATTNVLTDYLHLEKVVALSEAIASVGGDNRKRQIDTLLDSFIKSSEDFKYLEGMSSESAISEILGLLEVAGYADSLVATNFRRAFVLSLSGETTEMLLANEAYKAVQDRDWDSIRTLRLDSQARLALEQEFGLEYARRLETDPSIEVKIRPWVAFLVSEYTGTKPSDISKIWDFYQDVRVGLDPDQQKLTDSIMGVMFAGGQMSADILGSPLLIAEGGVELGFDALDFVLYEITGSMEYAAGAESVIDRYVNVVSLTSKLIDDPKYALEPFKEQQNYIDQLYAEGEYALAGKLQAELYAQVVTIAYGVTSMVLISRNGPIKIHIDDERVDFEAALESRVKDRADELIVLLSGKGINAAVATSRSGVNGFYESPNFENLGKGLFSKRNFPGDVLVKSEDGLSMSVKDIDGYMTYIQLAYERQGGQVMHPVTEGWIRDHLNRNKGAKFSILDDGMPGFHAEVRAMNHLNHFLDEKGIDQSSFDYSLVDVAVYKISKPRQGEPFPACFHCSGIIPAEVNIITKRRTFDEDAQSD